MGIKKLYKQVKNNKNKWQSIKHVTSNKYTQSHMHYTGLFDMVLKMFVVLCSIFIT